MTVLVAALSLLTWVPDLLLFGFHGLLAGDGWLGKNLGIAWAIFLSAMLWIVVQSLMALAISAWVKWRIVASGLLFGIFFVAAGFGQAINAILRTYWGNLLNLQYLLQTVWRELFDLPEVTRGSRRYLEAGAVADVPVGIAWVMIALLSFGCLLLLHRRLRAKEVVRG
jgi:ABC-2 type transport system permease protein